MQCALCCKFLSSLDLIAEHTVIIQLEQLRGNIYINAVHKNNNDNNTTPIFIGLHKTTQKISTLQEEGGTSKAID